MLPTSLRLASYNAAGLTEVKQDFCISLLVKKSIDILFVQETFWTKERSTSNLSPAFFHHLPYHPRPVDDGTGVPRRTKARNGLAVFVGERLIPLKHQILVVHEDEIGQSTLTIRVGHVLITTVYFPPGMDDEEWKSAFQAIPMVPSHDSTTVHLLLGDWNTRLGGLTGDIMTCDRAPFFTQIMQSRTLTVVPFASSRATFQNSRAQSSILDFVLVSAEHLTSCSAVKVLKDSGTSDHFPIVIDLFGNSSVEQFFLQRPQRIAIHLLKKNSRVRNAYSEEVNLALGDLLAHYQNSWSSVQKNPQVRVSTAQKLLDGLVKSFLSTLTSSAEKHCRLRKNDHGVSKSLINNDTILANMRERRIVLLRQLRTYSMVEEVRVTLRRRLNQVNRKFERRSKLLKKRQEIKFYDSLEAKSLKEQQRMIKFAKNKNQRPGARTLTPEKLKEYSRHFAAMFNFRDGFTYDQTTQMANAAKRNPKLRTAEMPRLSDLTPFFSTHTIEHFIRTAPNGKAPGCSGVTAEIMKPVASSVAMILRLVAKIMYCTGLCPKSFKKANIMPVPKKTHSNDIKDFRPISLTEAPRRILEKCLALYLKPFELKLTHMQGGFRERHSTLDQAAVLQQVMSTRYNSGKSTVVAFLDIKAAYDSVDRQLLWECCMECQDLRSSG